jgi:hypothetical protein
MAAPVVDSVALVIEGEEGRIPVLRGAFEAAVEAGNPQLIFSTGGALLATLYSLAYNKLGHARDKPSQMEDVTSRISQMAAIFLSEE